MNIIAQAAQLEVLYFQALDDEPPHRYKCTECWEWHADVLDCERRKNGQSTSTAVPG